MQDVSNHTDLKKSDQEIWVEFKSGSEKALELMYHCHIRALFNYGIKIVKDEDLVEDCIQEMFIDLWKRRAHLGNTRFIKFYLLKALKRKIIRKISKTKKILAKSDIKEDYAFEVVFSCESKLIREELNHEQKEQINRALTALTKRQREAIYLKFYNHLSYEQIALVMNIDKSAVYTLIFKSVNKLRKYLQKQQIYSMPELLLLLATFSFLLNG